jgi:hypothetical protein
MEINNLLKQFSKECGKKLNLYGILQFGSSTYSKDAKDIDIVFFSKDKVFATEDYFVLFELIDKFEKDHEEFVFDIAGGKRKKKAKYSVSIIPLQMLDLDWKIDSFFLKNLSEDKNKIILFGEDPTNVEIKLDKKDIAERLSIEINHHLRDYLEKENRKETLYGLFKTTLRLMLTNQGIPKKEELIQKFKENFKITLPKNSKEILKQNISEKDYKEILKFSEDCLLFLSK